MQHIRYVIWQDDDARLGYTEAFPDYPTQGQSLVDLEDIHKELTGGVIPCARKATDF